MYNDDPKVAFDEKTLLEEKWLNDSLYTNIALKHYPVRGLRKGNILDQIL